jgi:biotin carboxylase
MNPRIVVNYGIGSAGPAAIAGAATGKCELLWHCDLGDAHIRTMLPVLRRHGTVLTTEPDASLDERAKVIGAAEPDGITTFSDARLVDTALLAWRIGLPYHTPSVAQSIADKYAQRSALAEAGLQDIEFRRVSSQQALIRAVHELRLPVVVKPVRGRGSRHTFRVAVTADVDAVLATLTDEIADGLIVEEELAGTPDPLGRGIGDYVSVETVTVDGVHQVAGVVGRLTVAPPYRERGFFYPSTLRPETKEAVCGLVLRALTALDVRTGVCHTEVKLTPSGPEIIEVNGRLGGYVSWLISRNGGSDLIAAALAAALGQRLPAGEGGPNGVTFRHIPPAPSEVGIVDEVTGLREVRKLACVESVEPRIRRGTRLDWRDGTPSYLADVSGIAATHEEMATCVERVEQLLQVSLTNVE